MKQKKGLLLTILLLIVLCFAGCGEKNTTRSGLDLGKRVEYNVDIMGVRYNLYSKGYAGIVKVLNEHCSMTDTVSYEGKEYTVVKMDNSNVVGIFGATGVLVEAPEVLELPDGITDFTSKALQGCSSKTIILPENLKFIGSESFSQCTEIETIEFPDTVEAMVGYYCFAGCTNLKELELPKDIEYMGFGTTGMFSGCSMLETITIPGNASWIGENTFHNCEALHEVILEDGISKIDYRSFENCPLLEEIVFPDSVTTMQDNVFYDCPNLKDVYLSDNQSDVPPNLFKQAYGNYDADTSGITIHVKADIVDYVQNLYPDATVVAK